MIPFSAVLAAAALAFMYYIMLPLSLRMLIRFAKNMDLGPQVVLVEGETSTGSDEGSNGSGTSSDTANGGDAMIANGGGEVALPMLPHIPAFDHQPPGMAPGEIYYDTRLNQVRLMLPNGKVVGLDAHADTGVSQQFQLKTYLNLILGLILAFSIAFQLPLVLLLLGWVGLVTPQGLGKQRKYALLAVFIFAAALTPPDVVSQITLGIPLYLLFEASLLLMRFLPLSRVTGASPEEA